MSDFAVRCNDCNFIAYPLSEKQAISIATEHTEINEHSDCHAITESALLPLVGKYE